MTHLVISIVLFVASLGVSKPYERTLNDRYLLAAALFSGLGTWQLLWWIDGSNPFHP